MSKFVDEYLAWLKANISEKQINDCIEITTPFLDRHNDWLQIYVEETDDDRIYLTDDGYILNDLQNCGIDIKTDARKRILSNIVNGYGIQISKDNELCIVTDRASFAQKKHMLIQCMMSVDDLYITSKSNTISIFAEEVQQFFDDNDILYIPDVQFVGKSGFSHKFDFSIPHTKKRPEILIKSINNPSNDSIKLSLFQWEDTRKNRRTDSQLIVYLNDTKHISSNVINSCKSYGIKAFPWKERNNSLSDFVA